MGLIRSGSRKKRRVGQKKRGRPFGTLKLLLLTPAAIAEAAETGCTDQEIAALSGVTDETLRKRHRRELEYGRAKRRYELRTKQYEQAKAGNGTMLVWLGKNDLGQSDHVTNEEFTYDLNNLTREELERFAAGQPLKKILAGREHAPGAS